MQQLDKASNDKTMPPKKNGMQYIAEKIKYTKENMIQKMKSDRKQAKSGPRNALGQELDFLLHSGFRLPNNL